MNVVAADNISIEPSLKNSNRVFPLTTVNSMLVTSPNTAAATARHISTSNPSHLSPSSESNVSCEKPGNSSLVPHIRYPLFTTLSYVEPYVGIYSGLTFCPSATEPVTIIQNVQINAMNTLPTIIIVTPDILLEVLHLQSGLTWYNISGVRLP